MSISLASRRSDLSRLAAGVAAKPLDTVTRMIYGDALEEAGKTKDARAQRRYAGWLADTSTFSLGLLTAGQQKKIRNLAGESRCPLKYGKEESIGIAPEARGERASHNFKNGGPCMYPGAAIRAGYKVEYNASTRRVVVGLLWLIQEGWLKRVASAE